MGGVCRLYANITPLYMRLEHLQISVFSRGHGTNHPLKDTEGLHTISHILEQIPSTPNALKI